MGGVPRRRAVLFCLWLALCLGRAPAAAASDAPEVTPEHLAKVHAAYREAKKAGFTKDAMVKLYSVEGAGSVAAVVKKLVDIGKSKDPKVAARGISSDDSAAMETTRQAMNMEVLRHLAVVTGGSVEVMDAGKRNGIRSDKDLLLFGVTDGKRPVSATEMKALYEESYREIHGIDLERLDMTVFDADANIPDWRRANMTFEEYAAKYKRGQARLEQNPGAVREAGTYRQGAELRYATNSKVTMVRHVPERMETRKGTGDDRPWKEERHPDGAGGEQKFEVIEDVHVKEASERYKAWSADMPYRNAMDAAYEWRERCLHSTDFVDKMKYFNRTVGDGVNALAKRGWHVQYIFHLDKFKHAEERHAFIQRLVEDVYGADLAAEARAHAAKVIELSATIELDKMRNQTKPEAEYLKPLIADEQKEAKSKGRVLSDGEALARARTRFFGYQDEVMKWNLVLSTRQKLRMDLGDPERLARVKAKYGEEQAKKLQWETWHQIGRIFGQLDDDVLIGRIVSDAPESIRGRLEDLREIGRVRREERRRAERLRIAKSDPEEARKTGPKEQDASRKARGNLEEKATRAQKVLDRIGKGWDEFKKDFREGEYSDAAIEERVRGQMLEALGFEERMVVKKMEAEFEAKFSKSKVLKNALSLGNVSSALSILKVYQETGDLRQVAQTAAWELVSNLPGVSQAATLKQSFNDGDYQSLSWLFIAWQVPGAGHVKLVFDVAKGSLELVYNHAMDPLKDDRFSQVYMGYVDRQPAGWSPLVPGWKERRDAAGMSILHFVPGETFEAKRSNMYKYFHDKLGAKLRANGREPTTAKYWELYYQVMPVFFRKYVEDYFNAGGEWYENTTAGLRGLGTEREIKERVIRQLIRDFEQGERNYEKAEQARQRMEEALARTDDVVKKNIELERDLLAAEAFLARKVQDAAEEAVSKAGPLKPPSAKPVVEVEAYPKVVTEGQEATIVVQTIAPSPEGSEKRPLQVEVKRKGAEALNPENGAFSPEQLQKEFEEDVDLIRSLLDEPGAEKKNFYATGIDYEVTVKDEAGAVVEQKTVRVNLAGGERPQGKGTVEMKLRRMVEIPRPPPDPSTKGTWAGELERHSKHYRLDWEEFESSKANPFDLAPVSGGLYPWALEAFVWVRWEEAPLNKSYYIETTVTGGVPPAKREHGDWVRGQQDFVPDPKTYPPPPGNAFIVGFAWPQESAGEFELEGRILAYDRYARQDEERLKQKPIAEFPFSAPFSYTDWERPAKGRAMLSEGGVLSASVEIQKCQAGRRVAKIAVGGKTRYAMTGTGPALQVGTGDVGGIRSADAAEVSFLDFGKEIALRVPLEVSGKAKPKAPEAGAVAKAQRELEDLRKNEDANLEKIAGAYAGLASQHDFRALGLEHYGAWKENRTKEIEYRGRALGAAANPLWKGYGESGLSWMADPGQRQAEVEKTVKRLRSSLCAALYDAIRSAAGGEETAQVQAWVTQYEAACGPLLPGEDRVTYLYNEASHQDILCRMTFQLTGDVEAARAFHERKNQIQTAIHPDYKPVPFEYETDPAFRK